MLHCVVVGCSREKQPGDDSAAHPRDRLGLVAVLSAAPSIDPIMKLRAQQVLCYYQYRSMHGSEASLPRASSSMSATSPQLHTCSCAEMRALSAFSADCQHTLSCYYRARSNIAVAGPLRYREKTTYRLSPPEHHQPSFFLIFRRSIHHLIPVVFLQLCQPKPLPKQTPK